MQHRGTYSAGDGNWRISPDKIVIRYPCISPDFLKYDSNYTKYDFFRQEQSILQVNWKLLTRLITNLATSLCDTVMNIARPRPITIQSQFLQ